MSDQDDLIQIRDAEAWGIDELAKHLPQRVPRDVFVRVVKALSGRGPNVTVREIVEASAKDKPVAYMNPNGGAQPILLAHQLEHRLDRADYSVPLFKG